ncbi:unnamed protein product [Moneuplotes crassus]|uniref:Uncharacterized protein n=1 Tax=Euplotes crassus TaxID=5936 RepID=A0AAD2CW69_EUPCR|nr:unnamed protein product [Moneuplotes crassus]
MQHAIFDNIMNKSDEGDLNFITVDYIFHLLVSVCVILFIHILDNLQDFAHDLIIGSYQLGQKEPVELSQHLIVMQSGKIALSD